MTQVDELQALRDRLKTFCDLHACVASRNKMPTLDEVRSADWVEFVKDYSGVMLAISKGYTQLTGILPEDYEGKPDADVWGNDSNAFYLNDRYVIETGYTLHNVQEAWYNPKDKMYQTAELMKTPYPLGTKIGVLGKVWRNTLRYIDEQEYKEIVSHGRR